MVKLLVIFILGLIRFLLMVILVFMMSFVMRMRILILFSSCLLINCFYEKVVFFLVLFFLIVIDVCFFGNVVCEMEEGGMELGMMLVLFDKWVFWFVEKIVGEIGCFGEVLCICFRLFFSFWSFFFIWLMWFLSWLRYLDFFIVVC